LIATALLAKANSSSNAALNVPDLPALGLADSPVIAHVPSGLLIVIYLRFLPHSFLSNPTGSIRLGRLLIMNLALPNNDLISPNLSTSSSFWLIT